MSDPQQQTGLFVSFEGPEGAGKSTQIRHLTRALQELGHTCLSTREPGGTVVGDQLRALVLDTRSEMDSMTEFLIYSASRAQLVSEVIRPALGQGQVVLCDRYADSTYAYQGFGRGLDLTELQAVTRAATGGLTPDLTVLLDLPPERGLRRAARMGALDRIEQAGLAFHQRVRAGFLTLATAEPQRFLVLDAERTEAELQGMILQAVQDRLGQKDPPCPTTP